MESARQGSQSYACGSWFLISLSELYALFFFFFLSVIRYFHVGRWVIIFFSGVYRVCQACCVLNASWVKFFICFFPSVGPNGSWAKRYLFTPGLKLYMDYNVFIFSGPILAAGL